MNASDWKIGDIIGEDFTVTNTGTLNGFETWILEENEIPEGVSQFLHTREYEKTSGLFVKGDFKAIKVNNYYLQ